MPTSPVPDAAAPPGMCPGVVVKGGGMGSGGGGGDGSGGGSGNGGGGSGSGDGTGGNGKGAQGAPDYQKYPECGYESHPVDVVTGRAFTHPIIDLELAGPLPLIFRRMYSSKMASRDVGLGYGWGHTFGWELEVGRQCITVWNEQGIAVEFPLIRDGGEAIGPWGWLLRRDGASFALDADDGLWRLFSVCDTVGKRYRLTTIEDRSRNRISLQYEGGRLARVEDSVGRIIRVTTESDGRIVSFSVKNAIARGSWVAFASYAYNELGELVSVADADGFLSHYSYREGHLLAADTDRIGLTFHFVYDNHDRCIESWGDYMGRRDPSLVESSPMVLCDGVTRVKGIHHCKFEYLPDGYTEVADSREVRRYFGNRFGLLDKCVIGGAVMDCTYDDKGHLLSRTDEVGATTVYERDVRGRVVREIDPLGRVTTVKRDSLGLPVEVTDPAGGVTSYTRDRFGNAVTVTDPTSATAMYKYDSRGQVIEIIAPNGGRTTIEYDAMGNVAALNLPNGGTYRWTHDLFGNRTSRVDPVGVMMRYSYSNRGDLIAVHDGGGGVTRYGYDGEGHLASIVDPEGRRTDITWGGYHKVVARRGGIGGDVELKYSLEGELVDVRNARGEVHRLIYDPSGQLVEELTFDGRRLRYGYDLAGRLVRADAGELLRTTFAYNLAGELIERTSGDDIETFEYDARGDLVRASGPAGEVAFERDLLGRIVGEVQTIYGERYAIRRRLDPNGGWVERATSLGHSVSVERDALGYRRSTLLDGAHMINHERDALGREIAARLPHGGRIETHYQGTGRLARRVVSSPVAQQPVASGEPAWLGVRRDTITIDRTYGYDLSSELLHVHDIRCGATTYEYDPVGQLLAARRESGRSESFSYDATGNLFEEDEGGPRVYGAGDRLLRKGGATYLWDSNGRLAEKRIARPGEVDRVWTYTWKANGLLDSIQRHDGLRVDFAYDPLARRVQKRVFMPATTDGGTGGVELTRFIWDGNEVVHEVKQRACGDGDPIVEERTYCFDDEEFVPIAQRDARSGKAPSWNFFVNDPVGAPEELVHADGTVACALERSVWGCVESTATSLRFQGQYADGETGLHYNRFRYYDPDAARYISADPIGLLGGINVFRYGRNPTHWIDPLGLATNTPGTGVIYLRKDPVTGKEYVGKAKSKEAYERRKAAHNRKAKKNCPGHQGYNFTELETGISGEPALGQAEEDWIRAGGGPGGKPGQTGSLENKMHAQSKDKYKGTVTSP